MRIACITTKERARIPESTGIAGFFTLKSRLSFAVPPGHSDYETGLIVKMPEVYMLHISESHEARARGLHAMPVFVTPNNPGEVVVKLVNTKGMDVAVPEGMRLFDLVVLHSPCRPNDEFYFSDRVLT